jgi:hypothetical protein
MAFDLSTPTAQLAFGVAQRAQEVQDYKARLEQEARDRVNARLAPYGNDLSQFDSTFKSIYDPVAATQQSRAKAMQEYVTGLPELLARVQAEKRSGAGGDGGGGSGNSAYEPYQPFDPDAILKLIIEANKPKTYTQRTGAADSMERNRGPRLGTTVAPTFQRTTNADRFG